MLLGFLFYKIFFYVILNISLFFINLKIKFFFLCVDFKYRLVREIFLVENLWSWFWLKVLGFVYIFLISLYLFKVVDNVVLK